MTFPRPLTAIVLVAAVSFGCGTRGGQGLGPSQAVGTGGPASPAPSPSPSPTAGPPVPQDEPQPSPSPHCIHGTYHGVHSVSLGIYFLECGADRIPGSSDITEVPLGCRIFFNATPRDGMNSPTCSNTWPVWQVGPEELVSGNSHETFTPAYRTKATGVMSARCIIDGVRSGWIVLKIVDR